MPITASAKKALRQSKRRQARNAARKNKYKELVKEFRRAIAAKEFDKARALLPLVYQSLDKAAKTNVVRRNKASRLKSRLTQQLPR